MEGDSSGESEHHLQLLSGVALWLLRSGWRYTNYRLLFEEIARRLIAADVPLWRMGAYIPTIDPEVFGDAFLWKREDVRARYVQAGYSLLEEEDFKKSPLHEIARGDGPFRRRLTGPHAALDYPLLVELRDLGGSDYVGLPITFVDGSSMQITFATDAKGGFSDANLRTLEDLGLVLARIAESFAVRMKVERLLNTYLGRDAGKRVLAGQIRRGTGENVEAAILFADLRGFTSLSERLPPDAVLALLNAYFDLVGKAVKAEGGEILKFIGDGVMAVFPVDGRTMAAACQGALRAAVQTAKAIEAWNEARVTSGSEAVGYGIALHAGKVMYGNVGASDRLDFTVIGPVVNTVSRLQTLCRDLNETILISGEVAGHAPAECRSLGRHHLRGLTAAQEIFAPANAFISSATPGK